MTEIMPITQNNSVDPSLLNTFSKNVEEYNQKGFSVVSLFDRNQQQILEKFGKAWIHRLLEPWTGGNEDKFPIAQYHVWSKDLPANHRDVFKALNRYQYPEPVVRDALVNTKMKGWLKALGLNEYKVWDDGWGNVGFRLIRPGVKDGYPFMAKDWGIAKRVVSFWVPIVGTSNHETLALVPGSHLKDYPKEILKDQYAKGEPRFTGNLADLEIVRPTLAPGEAICYHPRTMHSEDVTDSPITRLNLEIRFQPTL